MPGPSTWLLTKFDEGIGPCGSVYLTPIQAAELALQLLQVLEGQPLGIALLCKGQVANPPAM